MQNPLMFKQMKKIKYIALVLLIASMSCTDMLDESPKSTLTPDNLFETVDDAKAAAMGMYEGLIVSNESPNGNWGVLFPVYGWGIMGTDIWSISVANKGVQSRFSRYSLSAAESQVRSNWTDSYKVINRANNIIAYVNNISASEETINTFLAEAHFIRALCYMDLVQFYGGVPLRLTPTSDIKEDLGEPRATEEATWAQVFADLEFAEQYLPEVTNPGRATKWAAKGLLAKAYLTRGGYPVGNYQEPEWFDKAAKKAYEVISQSGKGVNPTTQGDAGAFKEYGSQFIVSGENSPESLFELQFQEADYGSGWGYRTIAGGKRWDNTDYGNFYAMYGGSVVGSDFALSFNDDDIRFQWSIGPYGLNPKGRIAKPLTQWMPNKHRWESIPGNAWKSSNNAIVLRMADVYLLFAEAANEATGDPNDSQYGMSAYEAINVVRERAQVPVIDDTYLMKDSPFSSVDLLYGMSFQSFKKSDSNYDGRHVYYTGSLQERFSAAVLMERGWELCFERHRWFDLKRTGKLVDFAQNTQIAAMGKLGKDALFDPIDKSEWLNASNEPKKGNQVWPPSGIQDHNIYIPIPDVEIQINPEMSQADQNVGY
ncbi:RagB/SusD family nutrient uptake outer membrane protein [Puteibacter caeruleilacunae]|nr:RagB/SusD family nutrient uptake outer membrane protein [Puteibacter caeruleilacunae]